MITKEQIKEAFKSLLEEQLSKQITTLEQEEQFRPGKSKSCDLVRTVCCGSRL